MDGGPAEFIARYSPLGEAFPAAPDSLEYFLTERYCLYTTDASHHAYRVDIDHKPWLLHQAAADISRNTMMDAAGITAAAMPPLLHYSQTQNVLTWAPVRLN
jgi:uncharacterized protein YqjF (DUF2071 family)